MLLLQTLALLINAFLVKRRHRFAVLDDSSPGVGRVADVNVWKKQNFSQRRTEEQKVSGPRLLVMSARVSYPIIWIREALILGWCSPPGNRLSARSEEPRPSFNRVIYLLYKS